MKHRGTPTFRGQVQEGELAKDTENKRPNKAGRNQEACGSTEVKTEVQISDVKHSQESWEQKKERELPQWKSWVTLKQFQFSTDESSHTACVW